MQIAKSGNMCSTDIINYADISQSISTGKSNFARMIRSHFDHSKTMLGIQPQQPSAEGPGADEEGAAEA